VATRLAVTERHVAGAASISENRTGCATTTQAACTLAMQEITLHARLQAIRKKRYERKYTALCSDQRLAITRLLVTYVVQRWRIPRTIE
jgi:hypothetical protein